MNLLKTIEQKVSNDQDYLIAFYGPSTVSFEYVFPNWAEIVRYVLKDTMENRTGEYKKAYWNIQTANFGLNGASSTDLLERMHMITRLTPDLVFLALGKNDAYLNVSTDQTEINNKELIEELFDIGCQVILLSSIPSLRQDLNNKIAPYLEVDRKIAAHYAGHENFQFIDLFELFPQDSLEKSYTMLSEAVPECDISENEVDPVHYNQYGNAIVAKIILKQAFDIEFNVDKFLSGANDEKIKYPGY